MLEERQAASLATAFMSGITAAPPLVQVHCLPLLPLEVPGCLWYGIASERP